MGACSSRGKNRMRILCLHGGGFSAALFKKQLAAKDGYEEMMEDLAILTYIDAPHEYEGEDVVVQGVAESVKDKRRLEWFRSPNDAKPGYPSERYAGECPFQGLEESLQYLEEVWNDKGPFDGILGFSNGGDLGAFVALGCARGHSRFECFRRSLFFAVALSGGGAFSPLLPSGYEDLFDEDRPIHGCMSSAKAVPVDGSMAPDGVLPRILFCADECDENFARIQKFSSALEPAVAEFETHNQGRDLPRPTVTFKNLLKRVEDRREVAAALAAARLATQVARTVAPDETAQAEARLSEVLTKVEEAEAQMDADARDHQEERKQAEAQTQGQTTSESQEKPASAPAPVPAPPKEEELSSLEDTPAELGIQR